MSKLLTILAAIGTLAGTAFADGNITGTVDAKPAKFLGDSVVYIKSVPNQKLTAKNFAIDQTNMAFSPHIVLLGVGDSVTFHNHDKVDHNVMSNDGKYDLGTWGSGQTKEHTFTTEGVFAQVCKIHPEMLAYVFVGQNRFAATVDDKGAFHVDGVPAGTYELVVWNPKLKAPSQRVTVGDTAAAVKFSLAR
jgi:plastocyanin